MLFYSDGKLDMAKVLGGLITVVIIVPAALTYLLLGHQ